MGAAQDTELGRPTPRSMNQFLQDQLLYTYGLEDLVRHQYKMLKEATTMHHSAYPKCVLFGRACGWTLPALDNPQMQLICRAMVALAGTKQSVQSLMSPSGALTGPGQASAALLQIFPGSTPASRQRVLTEAQRCALELRAVPGKNKLGVSEGAPADTVLLVLLDRWKQEQGWAKSQVASARAVT